MDENLPVGTSVVVRENYLGSWAKGFEIIGTTTLDTGFVVCRTARSCPASLVSPMYGYRRHRVPRDEARSEGGRCPDTKGGLSTSATRTTRRVGIAALPRTLDGPHLILCCQTAPEE